MIIKSIDEEHLKKVLVIFSGGTISMNFNEDHKLKPVRNLMQQSITHNSLIVDQTLSDTHNFLTPFSVSGDRALFSTIQLEKTIDSSNASPEFWVQLAKIIQQNYDKYDGFVIAHGTDTMAFTASALSFMLNGLNKTVALTGSQIPIPFMASDAATNIIESIWTAAHSNIPEVVVVFNHKILRGNRAKKESTSDMGSFRSPNYPELGQFRTRGMHIFENRIQPRGSKLKLNLQLADPVPVFLLTPRKNFDYILNQVQFEKVKGCVIEAYGSGTMPELIEPVIEKLCEEKVLVTVISQVDEGQIFPIYEASKGLKGCAICRDMTMQAAYTKMLLVLRMELSFEEKLKMMTNNLCGEIKQE